MAEEIVQTVRCRHCSRALFPSDAYCRSCGQLQQGDLTGSTQSQAHSPPPSPPSAGTTLLKVYLTGMGIAGGFFFGCLGLILMLAIGAIALALSAGPGPR